MENICPRNFEEINLIIILDIQVGEEVGEWLDTFALLTECTDVKFCNTTSQVLICTYRGTLG